MTVVTTFDEARALARGRIGLVPTMGFLHEGHLSLIEAATHDCEWVIVSVFVNPRQFGDPGDLDAYPRDLERDVALALAAGADLVVAPSVEAMYPAGSVTTVDVAGVSDAMEGTHRPGHFAGVATIVTKLFAGLRPHRAYFGRKDAQQLAVVTTMARDLSFPVEVVGCPILREADGLALSSRNVRIGADDRGTATSLSVGLFAAADRFEDGCRSGPELVDTVLDHVGSSGADVEYVTLADAATAAPMDRAVGRQFLAVAARVGDVRLIDNVGLDADGGTADRGTRLPGPSILYGGT